LLKIIEKTVGHDVSKNKIFKKIEGLAGCQSFISKFALKRCNPTNTGTETRNDPRKF